MSDKTPEYFALEAARQAVLQLGAVPLLQEKCRSFWGRMARSSAA